MENRWSWIHSVAEPRLTALPHQLGLAPTRSKKNTLRCLGLQWKRGYSQGCQERKLKSKPQIHLPKAIFFRYSLDEEEAEEAGEATGLGVTEWDTTERLHARPDAWGVGGPGANAFMQRDMFLFCAGVTKCRPPHVQTGGCLTRSEGGVLGPQMSKGYGGSSGVPNNWGSGRRSSPVLTSSAGTGHSWFQAPGQQLRQTSSLGARPRGGRASPLISKPWWNGFDYWLPLVSITTLTVPWESPVTLIWTYLSSTLTYELGLGHWALSTLMVLPIR